MEDASFIIGSWVLTFIAVGTYAAFVIRRGRELSRNASSEEMPWT